MMLKRYQGHLENKFIIFRVFLKCEVGIYPNFLQALCTWWVPPPFFLFLIIQFFENFIIVKFWLDHQLCSYETILKLSFIMLLSCDCTGWKVFLNIGEMMLNHLLTNFSVFLLKWLIYMRSVLWICPFLTFIYHDIFSLKYCCQFDLHMALARGVWNAFSEVSWSNKISLIFTFQLLYKLAVPWVN